MEAHSARQRVVAVPDKLPGPRVSAAFRRSPGDPHELKVFLRNAPTNTRLGELVRVSGMRWPIESYFEQAKGSQAMADYQTGSWCGWHHHIALVILAPHSLVRLRLKHKRGLWR